MSEKILPELKSDRLMLRPLTVAEVTQRYVDWLNDSEVNQFLETKYEVQTLETVRAFVRSKEASVDEPFYGIYILGGQHIGNIKLGPIHKIHRNADVSLFIGERTAWGQGLATEAISAISKYAFDVRKLHFLRAGCYAANQGSIHAFERAGYQKFGQLPKYLQFQGAPMDLVILGQVNPAGTKA